MIVITRNGKTTVYTGWRAWLILLAAVAVSWLALALTAVLFLGFALTFGVMLLLLVPAVAIATVLRHIMRG